MSSVAPFRIPHSTLSDVWGLPKKIAFRYFFCCSLFLSLFCIEFIATIVTYHLCLRVPRVPSEPFWRIVVPFFSKYIFHLAKPIAYSAFDDGDSASDFLVMFGWALFSALATIVWSILDRRRLNYTILDQWLRLLLRSILLSYGFDKLFPVQFASLTPIQMFTRIGDLIPMDLLWVFMGASKPYIIFSGALEVLAGMLLFIPRMATVGSFLAITVMANVFALNLAYNVSVKALSAEYLLLAIYLAIPGLFKMFELLVRERPVSPIQPVALSQNATVLRCAYISQAVLGGLCFVATCAGGATAYARATAPPDPTSLQGVWVVDEFTASSRPSTEVFTTQQATKLHLQAGDERWRKLIFEKNGQLFIQCANGEFNSASIELNKAHTQGTLSDSADKTWKGSLSFERSTPTSVTLRGTINGVSVFSRLHLEQPSFVLMETPFHVVEDEQ